jgi:hypothetical protein
MCHLLLSGSVITQLRRCFGGRGDLQMAWLEISEAKYTQDLKLRHAKQKRRSGKNRDPQLYRN